MLLVILRVEFVVDDVAQVGMWRQDVEIDQVRLIEVFGIHFNVLHSGFLLKYLLLSNVL